MNQHSRPVLEYASPASPRGKKWIWIVILLAGLVVGLGVLYRTIPFGRGHSGEPASPAKCIQNVKEIGVEMLLYANAHHGQYPPDIASLYEWGDLTSSAFVCPSTPAVPATGPTTRAVALNLAVPTTCSYIYLGGGKTNTASEDTILLFEAAPNSHGCRPVRFTVLFGDGHAELLPASKHARLLQLYNSGNRTILIKDIDSPSTQP